MDNEMKNKAKRSEMKILPTPNTEPFGDVIVLPLTWKHEPIFKWNNFMKEYMWDGDKEVRTHYVEFINGNFIDIPVGSCRICTQKIKPYKTKYYQQHYENGSRYCFLFDAANYYCEECAKKEASKDYFTDILPFEVNRFETRRDGETLEVKVYSDGSRIEEVTSREAVKWD